MRFEEERGLEEIQSMLDLARETVKKRLTRGKSRLAECLERKFGLAGVTS